MRNVPCQILDKHLHFMALLIPIRDWTTAAAGNRPRLCNCLGNLFLRKVNEWPYNGNVASISHGFCSHSLNGAYEKLI